MRTAASCAVHAWPAFGDLLRDTLCRRCASHNNAGMAIPYHLCTDARKCVRLCHASDLANASLPSHLQLYLACISAVLGVQALYNRRLSRWGSSVAGSHLLLAALARSSSPASSLLALLLLLASPTSGAQSSTQEATPTLTGSAVHTTTPFTRYLLACGHQGNHCSR